MSTKDQRLVAPIVLVRWLDSMASGRWESGDGLLDKLTQQDGGLEHLTVGWLIDESDLAIVISGSRHISADVWNDTMAIPKAAVLDRTILPTSGQP